MFAIKILSKPNLSSLLLQFVIRITKEFSLTPNFFECTYVHKKYFLNPPQLNTDLIPSELDMQNVLRREDIALNYPPFVHKTKREKERQARKKKEMKARKEKEQKARKEKEMKARKENEMKVRKENEMKVRKENEMKVMKKKKMKARKDKKQKAMKEKEQTAKKQTAKDLNAKKSLRWVMQFSNK